MENYLTNQGDWLKDSPGVMWTVSGVDFLFQQAGICLRMPRGSFLYQPEWGSDFHRLENAPAEQREKQAIQYARQALKKQPGLSVQSVKLKEDGNGKLVKVLCVLEAMGKTQQVEVIL